MLKKIAVLFFVALAAVPVLVAQENNDTWYVGKPIKEISYEGLMSVKSSELENIAKTYQGKIFTDETYWEILQKLYDLDVFTDINPVAIPADDTRKSVILRFIVKERPSIKTIRIEGNKEVRRSDIMSAIVLKESDVYNDLKIRIDERAVRDLYLEKGFTNAKISSSYKDNNDGTVTVIFSVQEGRQTTIKQIKFEGNSAVNEKTLKGLLNLKEPSLFKKGAFMESYVEQDKAAIIQYYNDHGYIDAQIVNVVREVDSVSVPEKDQITITFVIKEGIPYVYGGTEFIGNIIFPSEQLIEKIPLKKGDVLNMSRLMAGFQNALNIYYENGYTSNSSSMEQRRDEEKKSISFIVAIQEKPRSHIEHIIVKGNTKTKDHVVLREFDLESGDIFSQSKVIAGLRNLYNLQFFSANINPQIEQGSEPFLVDLIINVEDQSTTSIQFGVTFSGITDETNVPISAFAEWSDINFRGNGQRLSASIKAGWNEQSLTLGFTENWLFNKPISSGINFSIGHSINTCGQDSIGKVFSDDDWDNADEYIPPDPYNTWAEYENAGSIPTEYLMQYEQYQFSLAPTVGYKWQPKFSDIILRGGLNFSLVRNLYDSSIYRPADKIIRDKSKGWTWENTVWTKLSLDNRDISHDPSKGWFFSEQLSWRGLFPQLEEEFYLRTETKIEGYLTLLNKQLTESYAFKSVLFGYVGFSGLLPLGGHNISSSSQLYIDGIFNGRGWGSTLSSSSTSISKSTRGQAMLTAAIELRFPIIPNMLALDFFFDAAATWKNLSDVAVSSIGTDNTLYCSFGPGLRISMPQFPFRFLFATCFKVRDGILEWDSNKKFVPVLSFNLTNN